MDDVDSGAVMVGVVFVLIALFLGPAFARAGTKLSSLQETGTLPDTIADEKLSGLLRRWPREYVRWIITDTENKRYPSLGTDQERLEFIENFWARRDPFPETPENEYRAEYLERNGVRSSTLRRWQAGLGHRPRTNLLAPRSSSLPTTEPYGPLLPRTAK